MPLRALGWNGHFEAFFNTLADPHHFPGRVATAHPGRWRVLGAAGEFDATLAGRLRREEIAPAVGDWAVLAHAGGEQAVIHAVLPRRTALARRAPGAAERVQVLAANVDVVLLVTSLDHDFSLRRLERMLTVVWESGAEAIVVLNKADACPETAARLREAAAVARGVSVFAVSARDGAGLDPIRERLGRGVTAVVLGSSGVGKSTLINRLAGDERLATSEVRAADSKGRHTTTHRELIALPSGALVIDTPGLRELQLWASEDSLSDTFDDIAALAEGCRFRDCTHQGEPGCAVEEAVRNGALPAERLASHARLRREIAAHRRRTDPRGRQEERRWQREVNRVNRKQPKRHVA